MIKIKNLCKYYSPKNKLFGKKEKVFKNFNFELAIDKTTALLGPSGSGKSTLLKLIAGLERVDGGEIFFNQDLMSSEKKHIAPAQRNVAMIFQNPNLLPHMTVIENIRFAFKSNIPSMESLLKLVGLSGMSQRYPHELSGGQQQRVSIARAIASQPRYLLMDEPFSNLDLDLKQKLRKDLKNVIQELGIGVILISHDIADALVLANDIHYIQEGKITCSSSVNQIKQDPIAREKFSSSIEEADKIIHYFKE